SSRLLPVQCHVIAVDELGAALISQDLRDFTAATADDTLCVGARIGDQSAADFIPCTVADDHCITAIELAVDACDSCRQQALARKERPLRAGVDLDNSSRLELARDPAFPSRYRIGGRKEPGARRAVAERP